MTIEQIADDIEDDLAGHFPETDQDRDYTGRCGGCGWVQPGWAGFYRSPNNFYRHLAEQLAAAGWRKDT